MKSRTPPSFCAARSPRPSPATSCMWIAGIMLWASKIRMQEPRNPLYFLLLIVGVAFAITVLAVAVVPVLEQKVTEAGDELPASPFRDALRRDGWKWVLYEVAALVVLGLACMALDRYRRLQS